MTIESHRIDVIIMSNDGISIGAIVAVDLHDNHIISHFVFIVYLDTVNNIRLIMF